MDTHPELTIQRMPDGGYLVYAHGHGSYATCPLFAASQIEDALAYIKQEFANQIEDALAYIKQELEKDAPTN